MPQPDRSPVSDSQLAAWLDEEAARDGESHIVDDLDALDALTAQASNLLCERDAAHRIDGIAIWPLHDGSGEALLTVDPAAGPRLCSLTFPFPWTSPRTPGEAARWLLDTADCETSRLETILATGGRHESASLLADETRRVTEAAARADQDALDDLVHDTASARASTACNNGPAGQAAYLLAELGPDAALAALGSLPGRKDRP